MTHEEEIKCEHCDTELAEDEFRDDEGLCEECHNQAGIDRMEAMNDLD